MPAMQLDDRKLDALVAYLADAAVRREARDVVREPSADRRRCPEPTAGCDGSRRCTAG